MVTNPSLLSALEQVSSQLPEESRTLLTLENIPRLLNQAEKFWELLHKWNKTIKLTGARNIDAFAHRHFADSLFGLVSHQHLENSSRILDVGAGAGFPSLPLSFLYPNCSWSLAESHQRRCSFLQQAKLKLKLAHVSIHTTRIEGSPEKEGLEQEYDTILFRAVSPEQFLPLAHQYLSSDGQVIYWGTQMQELHCPKTLKLIEEFSYQLKSGENFCLYMFEKKIQREHYFSK